MGAARKFVAGGRRAMLAKVHLGAKELGLDEDTRRDLLERLTDRRSSADCTDAQLDLVLAEFKRMGWTPKPASAATATARRPTSGPRPADTPMALKARAMWKSLWNLGVIRNSSERALEAFAERQLHVAKLQWADQSQGYRLIEALKAIGAREGWAPDLAGIPPAKHATTLKRHLVQRQAELLGVAPFRLHDMTARELDALADANGVRIRAAKAGDQ